MQCHRRRAEAQQKLLWRGWLMAKARNRMMAAIWQSGELL